MSEIEQAKKYAKEYVRSWPWMAN